MSDTAVIWGGHTRADLERRNERIRELHDMGWSNEDIARLADLTPTRISQILRTGR